MLEVLRNQSFARLFTAQVVALLGTGLLTVALGLLAFDIAGDSAGLVLGTALTIKMVAYVGIAPIAAAVAERVPRKVLLVGADLVRAATAVALPFVTDAWHIYVLIFVLQSASATFTPAFQAVIPDVLPDERQYTRALSLSRLAYDLESLASPVIAVALLAFVSYSNLFIGTTVGFIVSAALVTATVFPVVTPHTRTSFGDRLTRGARLFWRTRELRALLALNLAVASATAMVLVNTVVLVQGELGRPEVDVALLLAAYGAGSMGVALAIPGLLDRISDRAVMLTGAAALPIGLAAVGVVIGLTPGDPVWAGLFALWAVLGAATALVLTPSARLIRRATDDGNRTSAFTAQFSLSHAAYIVTYPAAGALGMLIGLPMTALALGSLAATACLVAWAIWRPSAIASPRNQATP